MGISTKDLSKLTDEQFRELRSDILAEDDRREKEREFTVFDNRKKLAKLVFNNLDTFLNTMEHTRTSCSDENPHNDGRCNKCTLMNIDKDLVDMGLVGLLITVNSELCIEEYDHDE